MITVEATIDRPLSSVWHAWNDPSQTAKWAFATADWGAEGLTNNLQPGGSFSTRMFARDGSAEFMFGGTYVDVIENQRLSYTMDDGRKAVVTFVAVSPDQTKVIEQFDPESENSEDMQRQGWQDILNSFKSYMEA